MQHESSRTEVVDQVLEDNRVEYDLRNPPSRADVGMEPGHSIMAIDHPGGDPLIEVSVVLPDDQRFEVAVSTINIAAIGSGDDNADPNSLELTRNHTSVDSAADELIANAEVLGLDTAAIERWRSAAAQVVDESDPARTFAPRSFDGATIDDVQVSVEANTFATTGRVNVSYSFLWGPLWE